MLRHCWASAGVPSTAGWSKLLSLLLFACCLLGGRAIAQTELLPVQIGILDWRASDDFQQQWLAPLASLQQQLPDHQLEIHPMTLAELEAALLAEQLDFVITNPGHYVALSSHYDLAPMARLAHFHADLPLHHVGSALLVRHDRPELQNFSAIRNLTIGAVSPDAFGGFQVLVDQMHSQGVHPETAGNQWVFTGFPMDQLIHRLLAGEFDAVIVRSCLAEMMALESKLDINSLQLVQPKKQPGYACMTSTDLYPGWPFLRTTRASTQLARQVTAALMQSESVTLEQDHSFWDAPVSYQSVYQLFERLRIGPFEAFPHNPIWHWLMSYRYGLLMAAALLLLISFHHIRAEYLVRRRTRELQLSVQRQQQAEQDARQRQDELLHLSRFTLMGELAAGLAHELNQPLTTIANYARGSVRHLERDEPLSVSRREQLRDVAGQIAIQADQAALVIRNIRAFLRKEQGCFEWLEPSQLLEDALAFCQTRLKQEGVEPQCYLDDQLPLIYSHKTHLLQVLANLITNALDAMQNREPEVRQLIIRIQHDDVKAQLCINVEDRGEGIDSEFEAQLFVPFMTTKQQGMGLGLSMSRTLAESLGGQLTLKNHEQGGAIAQLWLPVTAIGAEEEVDE